MGLDCPGAWPASQTLVSSVMAPDPGSQLDTLFGAGEGTRTGQDMPLPLPHGQLPLWASELESFQLFELIPPAIQLDHWVVDKRVSKEVLVPHITPGRCGGVEGAPGWEQASWPQPCH